MKHFDSNKILSDQQHGFRKYRSCESQLITTVNDFSNTINRGGQTDAILLDFSKAFDKVDHIGLMDKMASYGIHSSILKWTESFLLGRSQKVIVEGVESDPNPVLPGVAFFLDIH